MNESGTEKHMNEDRIQAHQSSQMILEGLACGNGSSLYLYLFTLLFI